MNHVHFIGIGGSGLSAIARLLLESGVRVSGSDRLLSPLAQALEAAGARVWAGHRPEQVQGADLVVRSSAVPDENVEVQAARAAGIPVLKRAEFLGDLVGSRQGIAVAGSHGKTTTTAMIAWVLTNLGLDPSYIIGGISMDLGNNAHAGQGPHFVIEADEYDGMFLGLHPQIAVVTNVEYDHPDCYPTKAEYFTAFRTFAGGLAPEGVLLACVDDAGAARLLASVQATGVQALAYGIGEQGSGGEGLDYSAYDLMTNETGGFTFRWACSLVESQPTLTPILSPFPPVALRVPGLHNVRNALAAIAVAHRIGLSLEAAASALAQFHGTGRRFEVRGETGGVLVIDDYAHHPTEIRATLGAARARYPGRRLWAVWQPHTYSRTRTLFNEYITSFGDADRLLVLDVYAAREVAPAGGFSSREVVTVMDHPGAEYVGTQEAARDQLLSELRPGDVLLVLSAGDADQLSGWVLDGLRSWNE